MSCSSAIYTANTATQPLFVGNNIGLGTTRRRFGCAIDRNGDSIILKSAGYYEVNASITVAPTAIGTVTATLFRNGVAVPGATASAAVSTANNPVNLSIAALVREPCCNDAALTLVLTGTNSNVTNVAVVVEKI